MIRNIYRKQFVRTFASTPSTTITQTLETFNVPKSETKMGTITVGDEIEVIGFKDITTPQTIAERESLESYSHLNRSPAALRLSNSVEDAKRANRAFYRAILRNIPQLLLQYHLYELPPQEAVIAIKSHFTKHKNINDVSLLDKLRWEGETVFADVMRLYLTQSHVLSLLYPYQESLPSLPTDAEQTEFLSDFLSTNTTQPMRDAVNFKTPARY